MPADPAVIVYSSGSTADPKGAIHTQGAVVRHSCNVLVGYPIGARRRDVLLDAVLLDRRPGHRASSRCCTSGATLVTQSSFEAGRGPRPHRAGARHDRHRLAAAGQDDVASTRRTRRERVASVVRTSMADLVPARASTARGQLHVAGHDRDVQRAPLVGPVRPAPRIAPRHVRQDAARHLAQGRRSRDARGAAGGRRRRALGARVLADAGPAPPRARRRVRTRRLVPHRRRRPLRRRRLVLLHRSPRRDDQDAWRRERRARRGRGRAHGLPRRARGVRHRHPRGGWRRARGRRGRAARRRRARRRRAARRGSRATSRRTRFRSTSGCAPSRSSRSCSRARSRSRSWPSSSRHASGRDRRVPTS